MNILTRALPRRQHLQYAVHQQPRQGDCYVRFHRGGHREASLTRDQRRLAAIVSTDVVGYSRLMGRDESGTLAGHFVLNDGKVLDLNLTLTGSD